MMSSSDHETSQAQGGVRASDRLRKKTTRPRASRGDVEPRKAARGDTRQLQYRERRKPRSRLSSILKRPNADNNRGLATAVCGTHPRNRLGGSLVPMPARKACCWGGRDPGRSLRTWPKPGPLRVSRSFPGGGIRLHQAPKP